MFLLPRIVQDNCCLCFWCQNKRSSPWRTASVPHRPVPPRPRLAPPRSAPPRLAPPPRLDPPPSPAPPVVCLGSRFYKFVCNRIKDDDVRLFARLTPCSIVGYRLSSFLANERRLTFYGKLVLPRGRWRSSTQSSIRRSMMGGPSDLEAQRIAHLRRKLYIFEETYSNFRERTNNNLSASCRPVPVTPFSDSPRLGTLSRCVPPIPASFTEFQSF